MLLIYHQKVTRPQINKQKSLHIEEFRGNPEGHWGGGVVSREATGTKEHSRKDP